MRIFSGRSARFLFAAVAGIAIAMLGAGAAQAGDSTEPVTTVVVTEGNFPWG